MVTAALEEASYNPSPITQAQVLEAVPERSELSIGGVGGEQRMRFCTEACGQMAPGL